MTGKREERKLGLRIKKVESLFCSHFSKLVPNLRGKLLL